MDDCTTTVSSSAASFVAKTALCSSPNDHILLSIILSFIWLDKRNCVTGTEIGGAWFGENSFARLAACFIHPGFSRRERERGRETGRGSCENRRGERKNKSVRLAAVTSLFAALTSFSCEKARENKKRRRIYVGKKRTAARMRLSQVQGHVRLFRNLRHSWRICGASWRRAHVSIPLFLFFFLETNEKSADKLEIWANEAGWLYRCWTRSNIWLFKRIENWKDWSIQ